MTYTEIQGDLFEQKDCYYAHCISADFGMGAGIVVEFNRRFDMKNKLMQMYPGFVNFFDNQTLGGYCIVQDGVYNLITKSKVYEKPTLYSMKKALLAMKVLYARSNKQIKKIAMPLIGCGIDKLKWDDVSALIKQVFENVDVEIVVCKL